MKKTKIVATMSDFRCTEEFVKNLFDAGMDVVRVNSAHVSEEGATHIVETVHRVNPAIPIMIDTKGPEIRVTTIADEYGNSINFRPGDRVAVRGSDGPIFRLHCDSQPNFATQPTVARREVDFTGLLWQ